MEQTVVLGIVVALSVSLSLIGVARLRRAHRRQHALASAFLRARDARSRGRGLATNLYEIDL